MISRVENAVFNILFLSSFEISSDLSIDVVPTNIGWPLELEFFISFITALYFSTSFYKLDHLHPIY